jgi:hypothetical protein
MKQPDVPALIELLDDDTDAFGGQHAGHGFEDDRGKRWLAPTALVVFLALVVYGVATSRSSDSAPTVAATTTLPLRRAVTSTTQPTSPTVPATFPVPYYAAEPPRPYEVQQATIQLSDSGAYYGADGYQLWATPGSSATSGRWVSIQNFRGTSDFHIPDAYRIDAPHHHVAVSHASTGHTIVQLSIEHAGSVIITGFGIDEAALVRLADSFTIDARGIELGDPSLLDGFTLTSTVMPWLAIQGVQVEQILYAPIDDLDAGVHVTVGLPAVIDEGDALTERQTALQFLLARATSFTVNGAAAIAGEVVGQRGYSAATWTSGNHIVTVSGTVPPDLLITIARSLHEVQADEWAGMKFQASRNAAAVDRTYSLDVLAQPTQVATGVDDRGNDWTVSAAVASFGNQDQITWMWNEQVGTSWTSMRDDSPAINPVVAADRTYVLADLPKATATSAELRVTRPGFDAVVVPFTDIDPRLDRSLAAYVFTEAGPYHAEIVDATGTVLAAWPAS